MPAVAIVAEIFVAAETTTAIAAAVGTVLEGTFLASALTGAIITGAVVGAESAVTGALINDVVNNQPITGSGLLKSAEKGALTGGVTSGVTTGLLGTAPTDLNPSGTTGLFGTAGSTSLGETSLAKIASGTAGGLASGQNLKTAAEGGLVSGAVNYLVPPSGSALSQIETGLATSGLKKALGIGQTTPVASAGTSQVSGSSIGTTPGGAGTSPGSAALGQVLNTGAPVIGSETGDVAGKRSAWNKESLRYTGTPEEAASA